MQSSPQTQDAAKTNLRTKKRNKTKKQTRNCNRKLLRIHLTFWIKKKQVIAIGKKTGCDVELHPVEIIYNTPSILLFCRYANALRTLPDPLGHQHLKRSRKGAVLFVQHHLLDSVVGRPLGRFGVVQLVFVHSLLTLSSSLEQCGRNTECTDYNTSITPGASAPPANRQDATVVSNIARSFPQHTPLFS